MRGRARPARDAVALALVLGLAACGSPAPSSRGSTGGAAGSTGVSSPASTPVDVPCDVRLPAGTVLLGTPTTVREPGDKDVWDAVVRTPGATCPASLDRIASTLGDEGWQLVRGREDVFAVRKVDGRWQRVSARVVDDPSAQFHGCVLDLLIGTRPA